MTDKLRVGVIFGGRSSEHEVSLRSARTVIEALDPARYETVPIAITKKGQWLMPTESGRLLPEDVFNSKHTQVTLIGDPGQRSGLARLEAAADGTFPTIPLDVVFPVLHGTYGEDGTMQGVLEMADVPYVGCGVLASAGGMDKVVMKTLFRQAGLPQCRYSLVLRAEWERDAATVVERIKNEIGFPCFVKPANLGSSVGVSKATDNESLQQALNLAARYDRRIIVEEGILQMREIECAVLGNDQPEASLPGEYVMRNERAAAFLDYKEKYGSTGNVEFVVPAKLDKELTERVQSLAKRAFQAVDCAGLARVDFFLQRATGILLVNELNTLPGFTNTSGYPQMWAATGLALPQLVDRLIELALERHREKSRNETSL